MFRKVLIANRGEIAVRVIRTLREMGVRSVAAFSDADRDALFAQEADEAYRLGPAPAQQSYLDFGAILSVADQAGADAIHPGYGFLAENAAFAQAVQEAGMTFIGPSPQAMLLMGDKVQARQAVGRLGVPLVPGTPGPVRTLDEALDFADRVGYPVAVKAAGGGGGRGIRVVREPGEMSGSLEQAGREAAAYFKNADVYLERYFDRPRHVEVQVLGDRRGHLVHLGERDCSTQRRHQKLIEETPAPGVSRELRARMGEMALRAAQSAHYTGAGTVEFLLAPDGEFYFLEMNTRIQVEHPITEAVAGVDLIREMVLAAAGEPIGVEGTLLDPDGHAIEVRVNAENPLEGFRPTPRLINAYREPGGIGVRVDSGVYAGFTVPDAYDSLLAKVIVWAPDRERARLRMLRALAEYRIEGPDTTIPFAQALLETPAFARGDVYTTYVEEHLEDLQGAVRQRVPTAGTPLANPSLTAPAYTRSDERSFEVEVNRKLFRVRVAELQPERSDRRGKPAAPRRRAAAHQAELLSPMHGTVVKVAREEGEQVQEGEALFVIEAMKMENEVPAQRTGTLVSVDVQAGQSVEAGQRLAVIE